MFSSWFRWLRWRLSFYNNRANRLLGRQVKSYNRFSSLSFLLVIAILVSSFVIIARALVSSRTSSLRGIENGNLKFGGFAIKSSFPSVADFIAKSPSVISICDPRRPEICAATYAQGEAVLEIPGVISRPHEDSLLAFFLSLSVKTIVFNDVLYNTPALATRMKKDLPEVNVLFVYYDSHGNGFPDTPGLLSVKSKLLDRSVRRIGFMSHNNDFLTSVDDKSFFDLWTFPMRPVSIIFDAPHNFDNKVHIGFLGTSSSEKSIISQILSICDIPDTVIHVGRNGRPLSMKSLTGCGAPIIEYADLNFEKRNRLLSLMDININIDQSEHYAHDIFYSIAAGVPCITSSSFADYSVDTILQGLLVLDGVADSGVLRLTTESLIYNLPFVRNRLRGFIPWLYHRAKASWDIFVGREVSSIMSENDVALSFTLKEERVSSMRHKTSLDSALPIPYTTPYSVLETLLKSELNVDSIAAMRVYTEVINNPDLLSSWSEKLVLPRIPSGPLYSHRDTTQTHKDLGDFNGPANFLNPNNDLPSASDRGGDSKMNSVTPNNVHVAFITYELAPTTPGGAGVVTAGLAIELLLNGFEVTVIAMMLPNEVQDWARYVHVEVGTAAFNRLHLYHVGKLLQEHSDAWDLFDSNNPDFENVDDADVNVEGEEEIVEAQGDGVTDARDAKSTHVDQKPQLTAHQQLLLHVPRFPDLPEEMNIFLHNSIKFARSAAIAYALKPFNLIEVFDFTGIGFELCRARRANFKRAIPSRFFRRLMPVSNVFYSYLPVGVDIWVRLHGSIQLIDNWELSSEVMGNVIHFPAPQHEDPELLRSVKSNHLSAELDSRIPVENPGKSSSKSSKKGISRHAAEISAGSRNLKTLSSPPSLAESKTESASVTAIRQGFSRPFSLSPEFEQKENSEESRLMYLMEQYSLAAASALLPQANAMKMYYHHVYGLEPIRMLRAPPPMSMILRELSPQSSVMSEGSTPSELVIEATARRCNTANGCKIVLVYGKLQRVKGPETIAQAVRLINDGFGGFSHNVNVSQRSHDGIIDNRDENVEMSPYRFVVIFVGLNQMCSVHQRRISECITEIAGDKNVVVTTNINHLRTRWLVQTLKPAVAIVASRFEAFNIAAHELSYLGVPLLLSSIPAFVEFFDDAGHYKHSYLNSYYDTHAKLKSSFNTEELDKILSLNPKSASLMEAKNDYSRDAFYPSVKNSNAGDASSKGGKKTYKSKSFLSDDENTRGFFTGPLSQNDGLNRGLLAGGKGERNDVNNIFDNRQAQFEKKPFGSDRHNVNPSKDTSNDHYSGLINEIFEYGNPVSLATSLLHFIEGPIRVAPPVDILKRYGSSTEVYTKFLDPMVEKHTLNSDLILFENQINQILEKR